MPVDMSKYPYYFAWGNTPERLKLKDRRFRVLARNGRFNWDAPKPDFLTVIVHPENGRLPTGTNSALVEFENGEKHIISRNAIRKVK